MKEAEPIPRTSLESYRRARASLDRAGPIITEMNATGGPSSPVRQQLSRVLAEAISEAEHALEGIDASSFEARVVMFEAEVHLFLAHCLGLDQRFEGAERHAGRAMAGTSILPMDERVLKMWTTAVVYQSHAIVGSGDHQRGLQILLTAKSQLADFPGITDKDRRSLDGHIGTLEARFGKGSQGLS